MFVRRRRFTQIGSLEERLAEEAEHLRRQAECSHPARRVMR
jgi:hypothetical protein